MTEKKPLQSYPGEKARQGKIILRTPLSRVVFIAFLVIVIGAVLIFSYH